MAEAIAFATARVHAENADCPGVTAYDPIPMRLARRRAGAGATPGGISVPAGVCTDFLPIWREKIETIRCPGMLRWHLEVDPLEC